MRNKNCSAGLCRKSLVILNWIGISFARRTFRIPADCVLCRYMLWMVGSLLHRGTFFSVSKSFYATHIVPFSGYSVSWQTPTMYQYYYGYQAYPSIIHSWYTRPRYQHYCCRCRVYPGIIMSQGRGSEATEAVLLKSFFCTRDVSLCVSSS